MPDVCELLGQRAGIIHLVRASCWIETIAMLSSSSSKLHEEALFVVSLNQNGKWLPRGPFLCSTEVKSENKR